MNLNFITPNCAVLMTACNGAKYIQAQINSILNQNDVNVKIFISIDFSTDETQQLLNELASHENRIQLLPYQHKFGGAGPNFFYLIKNINYISFDYVAFADQDDIWMPNKLQIGIYQMCKNSSYAYSSSFIAFWADSKSRYVDKSSPQRDWDYLFESAGPGCTYILNIDLIIPLQKKLIEVGELLNGVEFHDWLIYAYARFNGFKWFIDKTPGIYYRQHSSNQLGVNFGLLAFWRRTRKVLNGYGFSQCRLIAEIIGAGDLAFIRRGLKNGRVGFIWLSKYFWQCRRKKFDRFLFLFSCLLLAVINPTIRIDIK
jgi:rhamnosyltransferase